MWGSSTMKKPRYNRLCFLKCTFPYLSIYKLIKDGPHLMSMYCVRGCEHVFYLTFAVAAAAAASSFLRCFSRIKSASLKQTDKKRLLINCHQQADSLF